MTATERKRLTGLMAAAVVLLWAVWLPLAGSSNIRFDSDRMLYDPSTAMNQYRSEGRAGLVWLLQFMGLDTWHPLLSGILFMLFFTGAGLVLCYSLYKITEGKWKTGYVLFFLLYGTCPILAFHLYFTLQIAPVGLGMLLAAAAAAVDIRMMIRPPKTVLQIVWIPVSAALLVLITSVYQSLIVYYAAALMILLFCDSLTNHRRHSWPALFLLAGKILLALLLYWSRSGLEEQTGGYSYIRYQVLWAREPVTECLKNIGIEYGKMMVPIHSACMSVFPVAVCFLMIRMFRGKESGQVRWQGWMYAILLLLLPAGMSILEGNRTVPRTQFALPLIAAFLLVFCGLEILKKKKPLSVLMVFCCAAVLVQAGLTLRLGHTDNERYRRDLETGEKITADLAALDAEGKPLIFLGSLPFEEDSVLMEKRDVFGCSYFEWAYVPERPGSATYAAVRLLQAMNGKAYAISPGMIGYAEEASSGAPAYPEDGYMIETDPVIIIKLSE